MIKSKKREPKKLCGLSVKKHTTRWNITAIAVIPIVTMLLGSYLNVQLVFLLGSPDYFNIPDDQLGKKTANLSFYSLPGATIATVFAGYTYDIFGRRLVLFSGFFFASLMLAFVPFTSPYYGWLVFVRMCYSILLAAPMTNPLVADYI